MRAIESIRPHGGLQQAHPKRAARRSYNKERINAVACPR